MKKTLFVVWNIPISSMDERDKTKYKGIGIKAVRGFGRYHGN
ncbi:hypothetical protein ACTQW9_18875 [Lachnospiraceae bacterium LCP19S3_B12]